MMRLPPLAPGKLMTLSVPQLLHQRNRAEVNGSGGTETETQESSGEEKIRSRVQKTAQKVTDRAAPAPLSLSRFRKEKAN